MPKQTPCCLALATISLAWPMSLEIGFSHSTCLPAASAAITGS